MSIPKEILVDAICGAPLVAEFLMQPAGEALREAEFIMFNSGTPETSWDRSRLHKASQGFLALVYQRLFESTMGFPADTSALGWEASYDVVSDTWRAIRPVAARPYAYFKVTHNAENGESAYYSRVLTEKICRELATWIERGVAPNWLAELGDNDTDRVIIPEMRIEIIAGTVPCIAKGSDFSSDLNAMYGNYSVARALVQQDRTFLRCL